MNENLQMWPKWYKTNPKTVSSWLGHTSLSVNRENLSMWERMSDKIVEGKLKIVKEFPFILWIINVLGSLKHITWKTISVETDECKLFAES